VVHGSEWGLAECGIAQTGGVVMMVGEGGGMCVRGSEPVTWVLLAEVLPPSIKGPAASLATAAGWAGKLCGVHGDICNCAYVGLTEGMHVRPWMTLVTGAVVLGCIMLCCAVL
jgi:hypothetical protein